MSYLFDNLLWIGLPLVGLPILIHLINMMRHQRIEWAAMEFLLASMKRNRTWIMLKQLLLLLLRMAAIAAVAFMVAQPSLKNKLGRFFGGGMTHHVILLDDSYSMSEQLSSAAVFEQAKEQLTKILRDASNNNVEQDVTVFLLSEMMGKDRAMKPVDGLNKTPVTGEMVKQVLPEVLPKLKVSELSINPIEAVDRLLPALQEDKTDTNVVYLITDLRRKDWQQTAEVEQRMQQLNELGIIPNIVQATQQKQGNLAITSLRALPATRAVGVAIPMEVAITNFGSQKVNRAQLTITEDGGQTDTTRRTEMIEEIKPGETQKLRFEVRYERSGEHRIEAALTTSLSGGEVANAINVDDRAYTVVKCDPKVKILLIEGNEAGLNSRSVDSFYAKLAFNLRSSLDPDVKVRSFLRNNKSLGDYQAIFLLNVPDLQETERTALEEYAKSGGGICFFCGDLVNAAHYNTALYNADPKVPSLFPCPLVPQVGLLPLDPEKADISITSHPIFSGSGLQEKQGKETQNVEFTKAISEVIVQRYWAAEKTWNPATKGAKVIASLRNGFPLAIEHQFGAGKVITFLTSAAPGIVNNDPATAWNNWGRLNASFVITLNQAFAYLSVGKQIDPSQMLGEELVWQMPESTDWLPDVELVRPYDDANQTFKGKIAKEKGNWTFRDSVTYKAGFYRLDVRTGQTNELQSWYYPYNLNTGTVTTQSASKNDPTSELSAVSESNTALIDTQELKQKLPNVKFNLISLNQLSSIGNEADQSNISTTILYLLVLLLLGEQVLAYSASYHTPPKESAAR
jgi:hypothetical protein